MKIFTEKGSISFYSTGKPSSNLFNAFPTIINSYRSAKKKKIIKLFRLLHDYDHRLLAFEKVIKEYNKKTDDVIDKEYITNYLKRIIFIIEEIEELYSGLTDREICKNKNNCTVIRYD